VKIREIVTNGMDQGEFIKTDPWVATTCLFGGAIRMIQLRLDGIIEKPITEYYDMSIVAAWKGLATETPYSAQKSSLFSVS
jgi:hypothetical protein